VIIRTAGRFDLSSKRQSFSADENIGEEVGWESY